MTEQHERRVSNPQENLFREKVVERLNSPEHVDRLMAVTDRKSWLALFGFGIVTLLMAVWAIWGTIPNVVNAQGILLQEGGILTVQATSNGNVRDVLVRVGDLVEPGQVIAYIEQDQLRQELNLLEQRVGGLELQHNQLKDFGDRSQILEVSKVEKERASARASLRAAKRQLGVLQKRLRTERRLFKRGLITKLKLESTRQEISIRQQAKKRAEASLERISVQRLDVESSRARDLTFSEQTLEAEKERLRTMRARYHKLSKVVSPEKGIVTEMRINKGMEISLGMALLNLEVKTTESTALEALIYVPAHEGKKIKAGMTVHLEPSVIKSQAWGYLVGDVLEVGKFPVSPDAMNRLLGNGALVQHFMSSGPAVLAVKAHTRSPKSFSGFEWTTGSGPEMEINAGTLSNARIKVEERTPISLLFPMRHVCEMVPI